MQLIDTHCHIHEPTYPLSIDATLKRAHEAGVEKLICVGTSNQSSKQAVEFAAQHENVFASVGVHPHDSKDGWENVGNILKSESSHLLTSANRAGPAIESAPNFRSITNAKLGAAPLDVTRNPSSLVAIGEIGLDYFYTHSPRELQIRALNEQIELAQKYNLPIIFHVREAFDDFWPIFDNFHGIRGELHSFTDTQKHMEEGLKRGLYIGVNGISTFTKDEAQKAMFASIPLERLLLETDAPFLTPVPFRGKVNEPAFVREIAEYHMRIRGITLEQIATATTTNADALFALN
ncbi:MAG TPA: TatD family hydrolase [Candidatus Saccharimonadales bacterium]|nr:TatD family hydrolase [Candidatus Saccharimonadales bacterium]